MKPTILIVLSLLAVFSVTEAYAQWVQTSLDSVGVTCFARSGTNLFAGTYGSGVFLSTNSGSSWTSANTGLTNREVLALGISGTNLFVGTYGSGVFRSTDNLYRIQAGSYVETCKLLLVR